MRHIAVVAALEREIAPLRRRAHVDSAVETLGGRPVTFAACGMGVTRARDGVASLLARAPAPAVLIAAGLAGSLDPSVLPGEVIVAAEVVDARGERVAASSAALVTACDRAGRVGEHPRLHIGRMLCAERVLATGAEKRTLGRASRAIAVDMESAGVAAATEGTEVAVLHLRAIVDAADEDLPLDFTRVVTPTGRIRPLRLARALLARPSAVPALVDIGRRSRHALDGLGRLIEHLVETLDD